MTAEIVALDVGRVEPDDPIQTAGKDPAIDHPIKGIGREVIARKAVVHIKGTDISSGGVEAAEPSVGGQPNPAIQIRDDRPHVIGRQSVLFRIADDLILAGQDAKKTLVCTPDPKLLSLVLEDRVDTDMLRHVRQTREHPCRLPESSAPGCLDL